MEFDELYYYKRAEERKANGDIMGAHTELDKALKIAPEYHEIYWLRAQLYMMREDYESAFTQFELAIDIVESPELKISFYREYAGVCMELGETERMLTCLQQMMDQGLAYYGTYLWSAETKVMLGRYKEAIDEYFQAYQLNPPDIDTRLLTLFKAGVECYRICRFNKALEVFEDIHRIYGQLNQEDKRTRYVEMRIASVYYWEGLTFYQLGNYERAIAKYGEAIARFTDFAAHRSSFIRLIRVERALANSEMGKLDDALEDFHVAWDGLGRERLSDLDAYMADEDTIKSLMIDGNRPDKIACEENELKR